MPGAVRLKEMVLTRVVLALGVRVNTKRLVAVLHMSELVVAGRFAGLVIVAAEDGPSARGVLVLLEAEQDAQRDADGQGQEDEVDEESDAHGGKRAEASGRERGMTKRLQKRPSD